MVDAFFVKHKITTNSLKKFTMDKPKVNSIYWFRKALRLHDNPALLAAIENSNYFWPIFILDPWFVKNMKVGHNRWRFLAQSLLDLDQNLKQINSRLFVIRGNPKEIFSSIIKKWNIKRVAFEIDSEPYAVLRDKEIEELAKSLQVEVIKKVSNTLYDPESIIAHHGSPPLAYKSFVSVLEQLGPPPKPVATLTDLKGCMTPVEEGHDELYGVPTLEELNVELSSLPPCLYPGGESAALERLQNVLERKSWICRFAKPDTEPNSITPSTTVLSPYVKFGCLSIRKFYYAISDVYKVSKSGCTKPPVSLHGQIFWREFFYTVGSAVPNFDKMNGNPVCLQVPWNSNKRFLDAWANAQTGYPFIDAIMTQLRVEGWIHHLARHAVACFLTRGDLWISWEEGMKVFEEFLLDADWSLNAGNWLWLSASAFFHQYFRIYSPVAFGKKTDKNGEYIKKYLPVLKKFPPEYIYEPWTAPLKAQEKAGCIIGKDYPFPIVKHDEVRVKNLKLMGDAYKAQKSINQSSHQEVPKRKNTTKKRALKSADSDITKYMISKKHK